MQNVLRTALLVALAWVCASANAQVTQHTVCEDEPVQFALKNAPNTRVVWEYSPDGKEWTLSDLTDGMPAPAYTGMDGYYRASYWDEACNAYQYAPVQQLTVRPFAERLVLNKAPYSGAGGGVLLSAEGRRDLKEVEYIINDEAVQGKASGFHIPAEKLPAIVYARNPENCEQSPVQLITLPSGDAKCNVAGGTLSTGSATQNLCLTEGLKTIQLNVSGNVGAGRFVLVEFGSLNVVASNTSGLFTMNSYPPGNYLVAHVSLTTAQEFIGVSEPSQLPSCNSISNTIAISTLEVSSGAISANGATALSGGSLSFSVTGDVGPNKRWVLLNGSGTQVLAINTTGVFSFDALSQGTYRVVHIAYGPGLNLDQVNPQNPQGCIAVSNIIAVTIIETSYPAGSVFCGNGPTALVEVTNPVTGKIWMDRNLGATQAATSSTDAAAYGDIYQWGRRSDGHQCRNSATTTTLSTTDQPEHGHFIIPPSVPFDWRSPHNDNLWQGVLSVNNPCPLGFRLPTEFEYNVERVSWSNNNSEGAFASPLKFTVAGTRSAQNGVLLEVDSKGYYLSSTLAGTSARRLYFYSSGSYTYASFRAGGASVRCIKD